MGRPIRARKRGSDDVANEEPTPKAQVSWARTQAEIALLLEKAGVLDTHFSFIQSRGLLIMQFPYPVTLDGRGIQMGIRIVIPGVDAKSRDEKHLRLMNYLKNKLEAVESGLVTLIQEFFPYIVVPGPNGTNVTMYETLSAQIVDGLRDGRIRQPELFPTGAKPPTAAPAAAGTATMAAAGAAAEGAVGCPLPNPSRAPTSG